MTKKRAMIITNENETFSLYAEIIMAVDCSFMQVIPNLQRLQVSLHDLGSLPWRRTVDDSTRQVPLFYS